MKSTGIYLRGLLMGISDLVPGISGGTIAFITGIYDRLINAIRNLNVDWIPGGVSSIRHRTITRSLHHNFMRMDPLFLVPLGLGILTAFALGARLIGWLLDVAYAHTLLFFIGMIGASTFIIAQHIKEWSMRLVVLSVLGVFVGGGIALLIPASTQPVWWYLVICGFIAISALFVPGISGSYLLLVLGQYRYMLDALRSPLEHLSDITAFMIGAVLGALSISRLLHWLLRVYQQPTYAVLIGLVTGSLLMPLREVSEHGMDGGAVFVGIALLSVGAFIPSLLARLHR